MIQASAHVVKREDDIPTSQKQQPINLIMKHEGTQTIADHLHQPQQRTQNNSSSMSNQRSRSFAVIPKL
jgi:hypothetical protein